jgi:mRNA-degrading endonuclease HigB of HigAB toxin-antitoxin module
MTSGQKLPQTGTTQKKHRSAIQFRRVSGADWATPADVKRSVGSASILNGGRLDFNIAGNKYATVSWCG